MKTVTVKLTDEQWAFCVKEAKAVEYRKAADWIELLIRADMGNAGLGGKHGSIPRTPQ